MTATIPPVVWDRIGGIASPLAGEHGGMPSSMTAAIDSSGRDARAFVPVGCERECALSDGLHDRP